MDDRGESEDEDESADEPRAEHVVRLTRRVCDGPGDADAGAGAEAESDAEAGVWAEAWAERYPSFFHGFAGRRRPAALPQPTPAAVATPATTTPAPR